MTAADWTWGGLLAVGAAVEAWAILTGRWQDTLSDRTRSWFRVRTRVGAVVFAAAWCSFAVWFLAHILS